MTPISSLTYFTLCFHLFSHISTHTLDVSYSPLWLTRGITLGSANADILKVRGPWVPVHSDPISNPYLINPPNYMCNSHEASLVFTKSRSVNNKKHRKQNIRIKLSHTDNDIFFKKALTRYNLCFIWQLDWSFQKTKQLLHLYNTVLDMHIYAETQNVKNLKALLSTKQITFCQKT